MSRSNSASTLLQTQLLASGGRMVDAEQIKGLYYGHVVQTDVSLGLGAASPIPKGTMTVSIPSLGSNHLTSPIPYPGSTAPPLGAQVSVGFDSDSNPIVTAIYGANQGLGTSVDAFFLGA